MNSTLKNALKRAFPRLNQVRLDRINRRGESSYGQEGEDKVLSSLLFKAHGGFLPKTGFYVDVGAHDPFRFSNTYFFYKRGWSGINIDAAPGSMRSFESKRSRDLNLEIGVGKEASTATFYVFNEPVLNTFDRELANARCIGHWQIIREVQVQILPLRDILAQHLHPEQKIDFMTIDVEGRDFDVLRSNDWHRCRPMVVVVEIFGKSVETAAADPVARFLIETNYVFYAKTVNTGLFVDAGLATIA